MEIRQSYEQVNANQNNFVFVQQQSVKLKQKLLISEWSLYCTLEKQKLRGTHFDTFLFGTGIGHVSILEVSP
jgi:hypothetical protein